MAFGIGEHSGEKFSEEITKLQKKVACECWFTSTGKITPLMIKYEDDNGVIQTIRNIQVMYVDEKNYSGILSWEYRCQVLVKGLQIEIYLVYYMEKGQWVMLY